jgi:two-component system, sensor histidine kinase
MTKAGHMLTAQSRIRSLHARIIFSTLNFCIAFYLAPANWLVVWLLVSVMAQVIERQMFVTAITKARRASYKRDRTRLVASVVAVASIVDIVIIHQWVNGGPAGKMISMLALICTLMHALFTLSYTRHYMLAAFIPHALVLVGLPAYSLIFERPAPLVPMIIVQIMVIIMIAYILRGGQAVNKTLMSQHAVKDDALKARRVAEQALSAKSNFLASVSHEIRTPMNAVVSSVHLLRRTGLSKTQSDYLNLLDQASDVLLGLVNDVLDLSKIEAGKMKIEDRPINLNDMLDALRDMWLPQARAKGLELETTIAADLEPVILSDALRLKQILFNLLSNAVKFTDKGTISIRLRLDRTNDQEVCCFEVEDQGIGIAPEKLDAIFLGFEQGDASTTRRYGGTGLGLTISQRIAHLMGGDLSVRSEPGVGSLFMLTLPYRPVSADASGMAAQTSEGTQTQDAVVSIGRKHVLIVDDHEVNRRIVSLVIAPLDWTWSMAADGEEAVDLCARERFDLILMDMQMPRMNGVDASRAIRAQTGPNQDAPIIALTANSAESHGAAWADVGVYELITKPVQPEKLIAILQAHVVPQTLGETSSQTAKS